jgi:5-carboxymethyl-2-hydroxymuconate isomerase
MPHMVVEYSTSVEDEISTDILFPKLCDMGVETGVFARSGIRVRGREEARLKAAGDRIHAVICDHLAPLAETRALNISMEIEDIHPVLTWKKNNTQDWLDRRAGADQAAE